MVLCTLPFQDSVRKRLKCKIEGKKRRKSTEFHQLLKQISKSQRDTKSKYGPAEIGFKLDSSYLSTVYRDGSFNYLRYIVKCYLKFCFPDMIKMQMESACTLLLLQISVH